MFARQITTQFVNNLRRTDERHLPFTADTQGQENGIINLYPQRLYQKIYGFGGAFTDSAGYVFSLMPEELRRQFLCDCFSEKGLCYTWGRCPVDSCDFPWSVTPPTTTPQTRRWRIFRSTVRCATRCPLSVRQGRWQAVPFS